MLNTRQTLTRLASLAGICFAGLLLIGCHRPGHGAGPADPESVAKVFKSANAIDWEHCPRALNSWVYNVVMPDQAFNDSFPYSSNFPADVIESKLSRSVAISSSFLGELTDHVSACQEEQEMAARRAEMAKEQAAAIKATVSDGPTAGQAASK